MSSGTSLLPPPPPPPPFHLLEITIISAQDLFPAVRSMRPYAVAWVNPDHKLSTLLDPSGHTDPTWNDKLVFCVADHFLRSATSAVTVQILAALRRRSDRVIGTVRLLLSALRPSSTTRFVALQVRRPSSLRPQGILNVGVAVLDAYINCVPLYSDLGDVSAFACRDLMGGAQRRKIDHVRGAVVVEREKKVLECKREKWRTELPTIEDEKEEEEEQRSDGAGGRWRWRRRRGINGRMSSCFFRGRREGRERSRWSGLLEKSFLIKV